MTNNILNELKELAEQSFDSWGSDSEYYEELFHSIVKKHHVPTEVWQEIWENACCE